MKQMIPIHYLSSLQTKNDLQPYTDVLVHSNSKHPTIVSHANLSSCIAAEIQADTELKE